MGTTGLRRRYSAFAAGLATLAMALGLTAAPATASSPPDVDYVALGDSYTAGTGAGAFPAPARCIQTPGGYVDVVDADPVVNLASKAACHGAFIDYVDPNFMVPTLQQQIASVVASGQLSADTELVSLTAGANDAGVNSTLFACATSTVEACKQAVAASVKLMPAVGFKLAKALASIHRAAPNARIAVLGYPKLFDPLGLPFIPPANQVLVNQGTALLNATLATSVASANLIYRANAQYIDVTKRFQGHEVNTPIRTNSWIFLSISIGSNGAPQVNVSDPRNFHPNGNGHSLGYAPALIGTVQPAQLARP